MPDLPLIGGHAPGTSEKLESETCVNLFIEQAPAGQYLRNRPGQERYDRLGATPGGPVDVAQQVQDLDYVTPTVARVTLESSGRHGYEVDDVITIAGATNTDWNNNWTITAVTPTVMTIDPSENSPSPSADELASDATVILNTSGNLYNKEIRYMWRYETGAGPFLKAVIGNRVYGWSFASPGWSEDTTAPHRFNSMNGPVTGAQMGDTLADGVILVDGVMATIEGQTPLTLTYTSGAWSATTLSVVSNTATFLDGYIIRDNKSSTGQFVYSDLYNAAANENAFNFATAEGSWDDLRAVLSDRRELWLFGDSTTEIWYNVGDANNPFQRAQGGFVETGIAAPLTAKSFDNSIVWLAQDRRGGLTVVRAGDGYQPVMISTPQINKILNERAELVFNAFAQVIRWLGHEFYVLTIPGTMGRTIDGTPEPTAPTPVTLVYDSNTKAWFRWKSHNDLLETVDHGRWAMTAHVYMFDFVDRNLELEPSGGNIQLVGGRDGAAEFYYLSESVHLDEHKDGNQAIECERTLSPVEGPDRSRVNAGPIELVTDQDPGEGGAVTLSYAKDGKTFTSGVSRTVGAATTSGRLMWKRVGRARRWIFRFTQDTTATVPVRWLRAISRALGGGL